mmetsp:Transcript_14308/g.36875  ORF Transcript_14308/g.36875 Transcript_14308/m.36875 type:complete len:229 (-) Transcript_14308:110-796(-)
MAPLAAAGRQISPPCCCASSSCASRSERACLLALSSPMVPASLPAAAARPFSSEASASLASASAFSSASTLDWAPDSAASFADSCDSRPCTCPRISAAARSKTLQSAHSAHSGQVGQAASPPASWAAAGLTKPDEGARQTKTNRAAQASAAPLERRPVRLRRDRPLPLLDDSVIPVLLRLRDPRLLPIGSLSAATSWAEIAIASAFVCPSFLPRATVPRRASDKTRRC